MRYRIVFTDKISDGAKTVTSQFFLFINALDRLQSSTFIKNKRKKTSKNKKVKRRFSRKKK